MSEIDTAGAPHDPTNRMVTIGGRPERIGLDAATWNAFDEICQRENMTDSELCQLIVERDGRRNFADSIADAVIAYFKAAASFGPPRRTGFSEPTLSRAVQAALNAVGPLP
ncbi:MAG: ribbon-helix-helix domain-containing protein [Rhodospirillaceae bacterium]